MLLFFFFIYLIIAFVCCQDDANDQVNEESEDKEVFCPPAAMDGARSCLDGYLECTQKLGDRLTQDPLEDPSRWCTCVSLLYKCFDKSNVKDCVLDEEPRKHLQNIHRESNLDPTNCDLHYLIREPNCHKGQLTVLHTCQQAVGECFEASSTKEATCACGQEYVRCLPTCHYDVEFQRLVWIAIDRAKGLNDGHSEGAGDGDGNGSRRRRKKQDQPAGDQLEVVEEPLGDCFIETPYPLQDAELADAPVESSQDGNNDAADDGGAGNDHQSQHSDTDDGNVVNSDNSDNDNAVVNSDNYDGNDEVNGVIRKHNRYQVIRHRHRSQEHPSTSSNMLGDGGALVLSLLVLCACAVGLAVRSGYDRRLLAPFTTGVRTGGGARQTVDSSGAMSSSAGGATPLSSAVNKRNFSRV